MVGIVIVSHSARIADGVVELARQMAGPGGAIVAAGGLDAPGDPTGTDPTRILAALQVAGDGDGVVVLMDLGSAVQSAEQARAMLDPATAERVVLCEAPLVEGAVAAAVAASIGGSLRDVVAEARNALASKAAQLGGGSSGGGAAATMADTAGWSEATIVVTNPMGLHARPAARFVQIAAVFDAGDPGRQPLDRRRPRAGTESDRHRHTRSVAGPPGARPGSGDTGAAGAGRAHRAGNPWV